MNWNAWALAALLLPCALTATASAIARTDAAAPVRGTTADVRQMLAWIQQKGDARGKPFAIVDKASAALYVYDARHHLVGKTSVLLGQTRGDFSVEGVGQRAQIGHVGLHERTTPAGRFESSPGRNLDGEDIVWIDYAAALAIHRLRPGAGLNDRLARLRSATPDDNRASWGCVVVPVAFYERVVQPLLGRQEGLVYVLPEMRSVTGANAAL